MTIPYFHLQNASDVGMLSSVAQILFDFGRASMPINELLLREFDREMSNTRKTLQRVPAEKWDWKPQEKSGSLGWMAGHVATLAGFTIVTIKKPDLDLADASIPKVEKHADLLNTFEKMGAEARAALVGVTDEQLQQTWTLKRNGNLIFSMRDTTCCGRCASTTSFTIADN
jgi:hypothetical protein